MSAETATPEATPAKFSRYRSVRRAQAQQQQSETVPEMPTVPAMPQNDAPVSRSMSRYHRRPTATQAPPDFPPPVRANTGFTPSGSAVAPAAISNRSRSASSPQHAGQALNGPHPRLPNTSKYTPGAAPLAENGAYGSEPSQAARDEARQLIEKETERQRLVQEKLKAEKRAKLEAAQAEVERREREQKDEEDAAEHLRIKREADEVARKQREQEEKLAEHGRMLQKAQAVALQKRREEEVRKAQLEQAAREEAARKAHASPPTSPPRHGGGMHFFSRKRRDDAPVPVVNSASQRDLTTIRPGGGGAVLGIDAPKSAINAGDRRVLVVCNKQEILLPVTPTTTSLDLIKSASNCLTEPIDVRTAVVLESFTKVGVRRPLRNYEHVRDVMNSWDDDKQNDLLIVDSVASGIDQQELLASQVPDSKPEGMSCYIHYSSKPGKWSKRYFTLQRDGQLTMAKTENSKDQENICHLSDFDIYSPTERKLSKVRPPKKICYAVKSQQKSNIYVDETRFVHFFCTNDRSTASLFYKALHGWRSWYLIHVMGEGQKTKAPEPKVAGGMSSSRNVSGSSAHVSGPSSHARNASVGSHYQLGSFMPLLDLDQFGKDAKADSTQAGNLLETGAAPPGKLNTHTMHARNMSLRAKGPPPLSYNLGQENGAPQSTNRQNSLTASNDSDSGNDTFASTGLLGRQYSQRQRAMMEKEQKQQQQTGPFTEGPSLISNQANWNVQSSGNDSGLGRMASVKSKHGRTSSDIQRSMSTRTRPKPLVDLTPQYKEPPQFQRKGKGFHPDGSAGPLVESATSIEEAIKVPPSTDWRARPTTVRPTHGTYGTGGYERTRSLKGHGEGLAAYTVNNHSCVPEDDTAAFTGGLLARAGFSQGHVPVGHGVMDGSKARGPMLDLREAPTFASGSLLASVERQHGVGGPVIDRGARRQSVDLG